MTLNYRMCYVLNKPKERLRIKMNLNYRICYILYFLIFTWSPAHSKKYVLRPGVKFVPAYVTEQLEGVSKLECVTLCAATTVCQSVSSSSSLQQCILSSQDVVGAVRNWDIGTLPNYLESDPLWMTYGEIIYPVTQLKRGKYTLTFSDARQACIDHNTTLATEEQVLVARAMGLDRCGCGWFANGNKGYVMQSYIGPGCGFSTGIIYCRSSGPANAWCVLH